jgi:hypothetical protein
LISTLGLPGEGIGGMESRTVTQVTFQETGRQLGGSIRNPLPYDLRDAVVLYGNTVYQFGDVAASSLLDLTSGTERSLRFYLQSTEMNAETSRWITADRRVPRVFGMLMFFRPESTTARSIR